MLLRHHARRIAKWQAQGCYREQRAQAPPQAGPQDAIGPQVVVEQAGCARVRQNIAVTLRQPHVTPVRAQSPCGPLNNASKETRQAGYHQPHYNQTHEAELVHLVQVEG